MKRVNQVNMADEFDLKNFQSEVLKDFEELKATVSFSLFNQKYADSHEKLEKKLGISLTKGNLLLRSVVKIFSRLGFKANREVLQKPDFIAKQKRADALITDPQVKKLLRHELKKQVTPDLFPSARQVKLVKAVTVVLLQKENIRKLSIQKDVRLFALIALGIYRRQIEKYCK